MTRNKTGIAILSFVILVVFAYAFWVGAQRTPDLAEHSRQSD
jgi:hypothetical protein